MADDHENTHHSAENTATTTGTAAVNELEVSGNAVVRLKNVGQRTPDEQKAALEAVQNYVNKVATTEGILAQSALSSGDNRPDVEFEIVDKATLGSDNERRYSNALEFAAANGNRSAQVVHDNPDLVLLISLVQAFFGNGDPEQAPQQELDLYLQFKDKTITQEEGELEQGPEKTPLNDLNHNERLAALTVAKEVLGEDGKALTPEGRSDLLATEIIRQSAERGLTSEQQVSTLQELQGIIKQHGLSDKFDEAKLSAALGQAAEDIETAAKANQVIHGPTGKEQALEIAHEPMVEPEEKPAPQVESLMAGPKEVLGIELPTTEEILAEAGIPTPTPEAPKLEPTIAEFEQLEQVARGLGVAREAEQTAPAQYVDEANGITRAESEMDAALKELETGFKLSGDQADLIAGMRDAFQGVGTADVSGQLGELGAAITGNNPAAKDQAAAIGG